MDDLRFYILFNSISVLSGQWLDDNENMWANGTLFMVMNVGGGGFKPEPLDQ